MKRALKVSQIGSRGIPGHRGGVERVIEAITPRLVALGHDVTVYCASWSNSRQAEYKGVHLRYVYSVRSKYLDTIVRSLFAIGRELFSNSDIVHIHGSGSAPLALLARVFRKKVVVTVHGLDWQRRKWNVFGEWFLRLGERAAVSFPNATVAVGPELKRVLDERYGTNVVYIPNGVEARRTPGQKRILELGLKQGGYFLYLARLVPEKQCHILIEAFQQMPNSTGMKLIIAGPAWHSASYVDSLRRLAGDDDSIIFTGEVDEDLLEELYGNCFAYVLPSEVEGMSLSLLDAMAFGACVVASDIPPNVDVLGDAGVTFTTGDSTDLSNKLQALVSDPEEAEAYRSAARKRVTVEFSWDAIAKQWEDLYESLT